jgi:hypothetical protein
MLDALSVGADGSEDVDAEALALALTWAGRIAPEGELPAAAAPFAAHESPLPSRVGAAAPASDELARALDARLFPPASAPGTLARALYGAEAEADETAAELHALYLTLKGERDPRRVLDVPHNASHTEIRRAYHARLDALDASCAADAADCLKLELRRQLDRARALALPVEPEPLPSLPAPEPAAPQRSLPPAVASLPPEPAGPLSAPPPLPRPSERPRPSDRPQVLSEPPQLISEPPPLPDAGEAKGPPSLPPVHITRADAAPPAPPPQATPTAAKERFLTKEELAETDAVLESGNWQALIDKLDRRDERPQELPPPLRLLYAIALREVMASGAARQPGISPEKLGTAAVGELMQAPRKSAAVRVVTRRLLRRRPIQWQKPPSRGISLIVTAIALAIGVGGGLIFSGEIFELFWK